jgi:predicted dehydrogenase
MTARILLVGHGNRGGMWGRIIGARADAVLSAIVEPSPEAAGRAAAAHPGVPVLPTLQDGLARPADLVVLATPPDLHLAQARAIFAAGLPLLAEKPLACALEEALEIVRLAEAARLPLGVGLNFRYLPVTQAVRRLLQAETLGPAGFGQFTYQRNRDGYLPRLNKYPLTMQHPMMLEQSIHHLDLIRFCHAREVVSVSCRSWNPPWSMYAHDSNVQCQLTLQGGIEVDYLGTWTGGWNEMQFLWRIDCAGGAILQHALDGGLETVRSNDAAPTAVPLPPFEAFRDDTDLLLGDFLAALRDGSPVPCDGRDHLETLALCWAAIESSRTGRRVEMDAFCERNLRK